MKSRVLKTIILPIAAAIVLIVAIIVVMTRPTVEDAVVLETLATPSPTPAPSPTPTVRPVYIPDPEELQQIPALDELDLTEGMINAAYDSESLLIGWNSIEQADYYLLCVLNEEGEVLQKDILWGDITYWQLYGYSGSSVLLLSYKDMGEDSAEDDVLKGAYFKEIVPVQSGDGDNSHIYIEGLNRYYIIVDKEDNAFAIFTYDENGEYTIKFAEFPCALGRSSRMTPLGTFTISSKGKWKTWKGNEYSPYYTRYTSGLYIHGPIYRARRGDALIRKHYEEIGQNKSSGCIRTTMMGARVVYFNCPAGTVVEIVESTDLVSNPGLPPIDENYPNWDPTDPNKPDAAE